ncbi:MAG: BTAD domain-containing putative transcriptional regulator [Capsulimonadales bacterium]|nr:BTAD domain-containing putative transcriptional regulator [Capsulimonadales bacterium]
MTPFTPWNLAFFGGLRATRSDRTITRFRSWKFGALLAFLAMHPDRLHTREELTEMLWPESDPDSGRTNLRAALSWLRRQFEDDGEEGRFLVTQGNTHVRLQPECFTTDVAAFERRLRTAAQPNVSTEERRALLEDALALYGGPLLSGYYDNWVVIERERLADRFQTAVTDLAETLMGLGEVGRAVDIARRGVTADPLREEANHLVVRLLSRSGETAAARRHYEEYARLLDEQIGLEPSVPLSSLLEARIPLTVSAIPEPPTLLRSESSSPLKRVTHRGTVPPSLPGEPGDIALTTDRPTPPGLQRIPLNRFVGRESELRKIPELLRDGAIRLLTITGPGGSGKTRLSQEAARFLGDVFPGGIWFVPLADCRSASDLASVATVLGLPPSPTLLPVRQVSAALNRISGRTLLLLDNLEQIVEPAASFIDELLRDVPGLSVLATSRIRLGLELERELALLPLPLPEGRPTVTDLAENPSAALFIDRARAVRSGFDVTERNAAAIARICTRLDGIPLALELAAAWVQTLTPAQIAERLNSRLDLLVSRKRGVPERHATLRGAIDWSYRLLSPDQQAFFARLSVFRGGWTLEAAEEICEEPEALEMLAELQERSLVIATEVGDAMRYRLLETLREFAADQLPAEEGERLVGRHGDFFLRLADTAYPRLWGAQATEWLDRLEADHDNFRAAIEAQLDRQDGAFVALELGRKLYPFWDVRGYTFEGRRYLTAALALPNDGVPSETRAGALYAVASFALFQSDLAEAETLFRECYELMQSQGNQETLVDTLCRLGLVQFYRRNLTDAETLFRQGLTIVRPLNNPGSEAHLLKCLGGVLRERGRWDEAEQCFEESIRHYRRMESDHGIAMMLGEIATLAQCRQDYEQAETLLNEQLAIARRTGSVSMLSYSLQMHGTNALYRNEWTAAYDALNESLTYRLRIGERSGATYLVFLLGYVALRQQNLVDCAQHLRDCLERAADLGDDTMIGYALCLGGSLATERGEFLRAATLFGAAESASPDLFAPSAAPPLTPMEHYRQATAKALGEEDFRREHSHGRGISREESLRLATFTERTGVRHSEIPLKLR